MRNCTLLFCFLAFLGQSFAQAHDHLGPCGVEQPGLQMDHAWLRDYQQNPDKYPMPEDADLIIAALQVHNMGNDDGSGHFPWISMLNALCQLQEGFEDSDIQFYLTNGVNYIENTAWNNHETFGVGSQMMNQSQVNNMLNTFIATEAAGNCGYYSPGVDACVVAKSCASASDDTWAHELGHYLSLPHTFFGWEGIDYDPDTPTSNYQGQVFTSIEEVDGSNCLFAADGFCDTSVDFISNRWNCNDDGENNTDFYDPNGEAFRVDGTYFMSYSNDICAARFSQEQTDAMRANLQFQRSEVILDDVEIEEIDMAGFNPIFPVDGEEVAYNYIKIEWEPIPGATHYYVEVTRHPFDVVIEKRVVTETEFIATTLIPNKNYAWEVRPFNWGYFCAPFSEKLLFTTNETVGTNDIEGVDAVQIFPTVVRNGAALNIQLESSNNLGAAEISLTSLTGVRHQVKQVIIQNGQNQFAIQPEGLSSGIYIVGVTTDSGSFYQKVVVQ
ncbi:MAG: hypothetical protein ACJAYJ_003614 [Saprospiraceae bacterium]|jgi:hypothetical protein